MWSTFCKHESNSFCEIISLAGTERTWKYQVNFKFSVVYLKSDDCNGLRKLQGFVWRKQLLPPSHGWVVSHTNPCEFFPLCISLQGSNYVMNKRKFEFHNAKGKILGQYEIFKINCICDSHNWPQIATFLQRNHIICLIIAHSCHINLPWKCNVIFPFFHTTSEFWLSGSLSRPSDKVR